MFAIISNAHKCIVVYKEVITVSRLAEQVPFSFTVPLFLWTVLITELVDSLGLRLEMKPEIYDNRLKHVVENPMMVLLSVPFTMKSYLHSTT